MIKYPDPVKRSELPAVVYCYRCDKGGYLGPLESSPATPTAWAEDRGRGACQARLDRLARR